MGSEDDSYFTQNESVAVDQELKKGSKVVTTQIPIGIAADHGGFELKEYLKAQLKDSAYQMKDFGACRYEPDDDYPDLVIPLARALAGKKIFRGIAVCGSGVGACIAANKITGVRAALISDCYSARQGVEDDDLNIICLGRHVTGPKLALELVRVFLGARFKATARYVRRLDKIAHLERSQTVN